MLKRICILTGLLLVPIIGNAAGTVDSDTTVHTSVPAGTDFDPGKICLQLEINIAPGGYSNDTAMGIYAQVVDFISQAKSQCSPAPPAVVVTPAPTPVSPSK